MNLQEVNNITMTEGTVRTIHDSNGKLLWGKLTYSTTYDGDTKQDGTPTPASPVDVDVVTGSQTVTISDGTNTGSFTVNLGTTELCKIGDYQDYIYKSGDNWYWHKEIDKIVLDGSEDSWNRASIYGGVNFRFYVNVPDVKTTTSETEVGLIISNKLVEITNTAQYNGTQGIRVRSNGSPQLILYIDDTSTMDIENFKTWLTSNNIVCYYALATPTDTQITDATLIGQLNSIHQFLTRYGYTGTVAGSLPLVINQTTLS